MNGQKYSLNSLITMQHYSWYFLLIYFAAASLLYVFDLSLPFDFGFVGVLLVLLVTFVKVIVIAEKFRALKLRRYVILTYALILVLAVAVVIRLVL